MNFKEILELIDKVAESGIAGVEIEQAGTKVRIEGTHAPPPQHSHASPPALPQHAVQAAAAAAPVAAEQSKSDAKKAPEAEPDAGLHIINSPIVGTFYRSANPEVPPFVNVGDRVSKGQVLCIIEAMKLMNEIESDADGVLTQIVPQNGQPVEYGERLFAVKV